MVLVNQVQFTTLTKHIAGELDDIVVVISMSSIKSNNIGFDNRVRIIFIVRSSVILATEINIGSVGNYDIDFGIEVSTGGDLEDI